jgi:hypothetical protein
MINNDVIKFRGFVTVNIIVIWVTICFFMIDGERNHINVSDVDNLKEQYSSTNRNAYCDHVRHLVYSHGFSQSLLSSCEDISSIDFSNF